MKENIFNVLIYLFEHYLDDVLDFMPDSEVIKTELFQAGFTTTEVNKAFDWLETLTEKNSIKPSISSAFRIFCDEEKIKLDLECRNFLLFLEHGGIITACTREIVIDRALATEHEKLTLDELKWIVLLVLLNQTDEDMAVCIMEDIVYNPTPIFLH